MKDVDNEGHRWRENRDLISAEVSSFTFDPSMQCIIINHIRVKPVFYISQNSVCFVLGSFAFVQGESPGDYSVYSRENFHLPVYHGQNETLLQIA